MWYLTKEQYRFRTELTTENATYNLPNEILNVLNNKWIVEVIFCNLQKDFISVDHDILLSKLAYCEITRIHNAFYKSYLHSYGPGVDSASNRNEYQEDFLGLKSGQCIMLTTLPPFWAIVT